MKKLSSRRRQFLKQILDLSASSALIPFLGPIKAYGDQRNSHPDSLNTDFDCLILGAGMAGLTAAKRLTEAGTRSGRHLRIAILEGSGRIGGRIFTTHDLIKDPKGKKMALELGAEYIHRRPHSVPIWHDVFEMNARIQSLPKTSNSYMYHSSFEGEKLKKIFSLFRDSAVGQWGVLEAGSVYSRINRYRGPDMSAEEWIKRKYNNPKKPFSPDLVSLALTGDQPAVDRDLSILGFKNDKIGELSMDSEEYSLLDGYSSLLAHLNGRTQIFNNEKVTKIEYSPEGGVKISVRGGGTYTARTAICTFSVGMLQSGDVEFAPGLPKNKMEALKTIKLGHLSKFVLKFKEQFWPADTTYLLNPDSQRKGCRTYFNLSTTHGAPILLALVTGSDVLRLQNFSDREVTEMICADLDLLFPNKSAPALSLISKDRLYLGEEQPVVLRKQWGDDPYAKGGTSFLTVRENALTARRDLAEPSTPPLFWAGEATALCSQPSTVHGAHESGIRAAQEVFQYLRNEGRAHNQIYTLDRSISDYETWEFKASRRDAGNFPYQTYDTLRSEWQDLFGWDIMADIQKKIEG